MKVVFAWDGLPIYALRCIEHCKRESRLNISIIHTKASVPIVGLENHTSCSLKLIESNSLVTWTSLALEVPDVFIHTGWSIPSFMALASAVRAQGGVVVSMVDNCWKGNSRQILGSVYFRLRLIKYFDAIWVPGQSGQRLAHFFGVSNDRVFDGLYGMDPSIFSPGPLFSSRKKQFLFVGRLIDRKGLPELIQAFTEFSERHQDWTLVIVGNGPLEVSIPTHPCILHKPFSSPAEVAQHMRESRALILPSREEHWGLVVHEAALSGCHLLLSNRVGAHPDLLDCGGNGLLFKSRSASALRDALIHFSNWDFDTLETGSKISLEKARAFGPERFYYSFQKILHLSPSN